jgi:arginyl-tRNA synthetase
MQSIISQLDAAFRSAIQSAFGLDADPLIAVSGNEKFGDYQSNAAMGLSKTLAARGEKTNPRAVAEKIKAALQLGDIASEISIAGPGFINVRLSTDWLQSHLSAAAADVRLGIDKTPAAQTVVVDYSGPNIAKELHVGHLRSTIIGDAVVRVLNFQGHSVIRQNHVGDWGTQFGMLISHLRSLTTGQPNGQVAIDDLEDFYRAAKMRFDAEPAFQTEARETVVRLQAGNPAERAMWQEIVAETRRHYLPLYGRLGVLLTEADERGESFYNPYLADVVKELRASGIAVQSEGAIVIPVEGFESPLIIEKTGGGYLYGTTDLAAIRFRVGQLHAARVLYFTDARQSQHFAQVFAAARKAGWTASASLEHASFGAMLGDDGKPFKTRSGGTVKLAELLDEAEERAKAIVVQKAAERGLAMSDEQYRQIAHSIGIGAVKYSDLSKDRTSDYVFSWEKALAMDGNTAPYLQYAYARVRSIFRKGDTDSQSVRGGRLVLQDPYEMALSKQILRFGEAIGAVARELKPHHLCNYLYELATRFSGFFENCPVLKSDEPLRSSRLALCDLTARTMGLGLDLLGIEHPEQM